MAHKNPQKPEDTQRSLDIGPALPRETERVLRFGGTNRDEAARRGLARPREAQRGPERPRKAHRCPERPK